MFVCLFVCNKKSRFWVSNSWDIAEIEFVWVVGGWTKVIFMSHPTFELSWGWVGVVTNRIPSKKSLSLWWNFKKENVDFESFEVVLICRKFETFHSCLLFLLPEHIFLFCLGSGIQSINIQILWDKEYNISGKINFVTLSATLNCIYLSGPFKL